MVRPSELYSMQVISPPFPFRVRSSFPEEVSQRFTSVLLTVAIRDPSALKTSLRTSSPQSRVLIHLAVFESCRVGNQWRPKDFRSLAFGRLSSGTTPRVAIHFPVGSKVMESHAESTFTSPSFAPVALSH